MHCPTLSELPPPPADKTGWPWTEESPQLPEAMPGGSPWPRISIVTPSYNQGPFIEETIRSVLLQGYPNLEYLIVDGGSTDETWAIVEKYQPWLTYAVSEPDDGQSDAINKGWRRASGEIIAWLNSDDFYLPGTFQRVASEFGRHDGLAVLAGECIFVDASGEQVAKKSAGSFDPVVVLTDKMPAQPAAFFHRRVLNDVGYLDVGLYYCMDREYFLRLGKRYYPNFVRNIDAPLTCYRFWAGCKTAGRSNHAIRERKQVVDRFLSDWAPEARRDLRKKAYRKIYMSDAILARQEKKKLRETWLLFLAACSTLERKDWKQLLRRVRALPDA